MGPIRLVASFIALSIPCFAEAGDWPQILGPGRNGIAVDEGPIHPFSADGPRRVWERPVGQGYAGVAVTSGRVYLFHRVDDEEVAECLDSATGDSHWKRAFPVAYAGGADPDAGPRCVPVVHADRLLLYGIEGHLCCLQATTGDVIWTRETRTDFPSPAGYFGVGSSPLVVDQSVLVNVGGRDDGGIVAYSLADGRPLWHTLDERASYSSPVLAQIDGVRHALFVTRLQFVSIDPAQGDVRFRIPFGRSGPTVNAANPVVIGQHVFLSSSYQVGARWVRVAADRAEVVWTDDQLMSSQYATCVEYEGILYGIDGREDMGQAHLRAFDPATRKVHWTEEDFGMATLVRANGMLLIMKTSGELLLARATPTRFKAECRAALCSGLTRALPALSDGHWFVRDGQQLRCFRLR